MTENLPKPEAPAPTTAADQRRLDAARLEDLSRELNEIAKALDDLTDRASKDNAEILAGSATNLDREARVWRAVAQRMMGET